NPYASLALAPFQLIATFGVAFGLAIDQHHIRLYAAIRGEDYGAVAQPRAGKDSFGQIDFAVHVLPFQKKVAHAVAAVNGSMKTKGLLLVGAEGGIRTPTPFGATPSRWCVCQFHPFRFEINLLQTV